VTTGRDPYGCGHARRSVFRGILAATGADAAHQISNISAAGTTHAINESHMIATSLAR
jgi:hypothetical protein